MSEECTHDCSTCTVDCSSKKQDLLEKLNEYSTVKKVIAVASGKGGVGKSMITAMLAVILSRRGLKTAILDADITGPSIPTLFGIKEHAKGNEMGILPAETKMGIKIISANMLLDNPTDPVVWRGPVIAGTVKQFWSEVVWGDVDYMFVDMPPGTGDVPLTVFQSLPVNGIVIVTSPQQLVSMIVSKAVNMAGLMNIPVVGLVENMSYVKCPDCGKEFSVFGKSSLDEIAKQFNITNTAKLPIDPNLASIADHGLVELFEGDWLEELATNIEKL